jgi:hypothetical protein
MALYTRLAVATLVLAIHLGLASAESLVGSDTSTSASHSMTVSYNVALVALGTAAIDAVVFDNTQWTAAGDQLSKVVTRTSAISYTLAGRALANTITASLSWSGGTNLDALQVTLLLADKSGVPTLVNDPGVVLKDFAAAPVERTVVVTGADGAGVNDVDVVLTYKFQIDVTKGPTFAATPITVTYTATAAAP